MDLTKTPTVTAILLVMIFCLSGPLAGEDNNGRTIRKVRTVSATRPVVFENPVSSALRFFERHQDPDGSWNPATYQQNCTEGVQCEPGINAEGSQEQVTAMILLCYLGAGYDHKLNGRYKTTVANGLKWILSKQQTDGSWGNRNDVNAICTQSLTEAYGMTQDATLKEPAQKALDFLRAQQNLFGKTPAEGRLGWDYQGSSQWNDSYVTGLVIMALKSAKVAGLDVGDSLDGAKVWFETAWKVANPNWATFDPYKDCSVFPLRWQSGSATVAVMSNSSTMPSCTPVGGMCAVFLGHGREDVITETLSNQILKETLPQSYPSNPYLLYNSAFPMFQVGEWRTWEPTTRDLSIRTQRQDKNCFQGSWDPLTSGFPRCEIGRLISTAYTALRLTIYYHFTPPPRSRPPTK